MNENSYSTENNNMNEWLILITMKIKNILKLREYKVYIEESLKKVVILLENCAEEIRCRSS